MLVREEREEHSPPAQHPIGLLHKTVDPTQVFRYKAGGNYVDRVIGKWNALGYIRNSAVCDVPVFVEFVLGNIDRDDARPLALGGESALRTPTHIHNGRSVLRVARDNGRIVLGYGVHGVRKMRRYTCGESAVYSQQGHHSCSFQDFGQALVATATRHS